MELQMRVADHFQVWRYPCSRLLAPHHFDHPTPILPVVSRDLLTLSSWFYPYLIVWDGQHFTSLNRLKAVSAWPDFQNPFTYHRPRYRSNGQLVWVSYWPNLSMRHFSEYHRDLTNHLQCLGTLWPNWTSHWDYHRYIITGDLALRFATKLATDHQLTSTHLASWIACAPFMIYIICSFWAPLRDSNLISKPR